MLSCILLAGAPFLFFDDEYNGSDKLIRVSQIETVTSFMGRQGTAEINTVGGSSTMFNLEITEVLEALKTCPRAR